MRITRSVFLVVLILMLVGCEYNNRLRKIILSVDVSPRGDQVAIRYFGDGVETIDLSDSSRKCHWSTGGSQIRGFASYSSSGELIAVGKEHLSIEMAMGNMHKIVFYDSNSCEQVNAVPLGDFSDGHVLEFSPDDKYLAVASRRQLLQRGVNLAIVEVETGKTIKKWTYGDADHPSLAFSDDGSMLVFGLTNLNSRSDDRQNKKDNDTGTVLLLDFPAGDTRKEWIEDTGKGVVSVDIASDSSIVALGLGDGTVKLVHYIEEESRVLHRFDNMAIGLRFSPNNKLVFSCESNVNGSLISHQTHSGNPVHDYTFTVPIFDFDVDDEGKTAVVGFSSGEIEVVDLVTTPTSETIAN
ncbi:MAG: WD40 repeat domain-containing protein [Gammaproteobacteria bacterium]|nr:WD40 repeat domain-containing protein [Gammaproteobacteria bacterium]